MANSKTKIKGNTKIPNYDSEIEIEVDNKYEPYKKTIPSPTKYEGFTITWFNNFGVKNKATGNNAKATYTIKLKNMPAGKRLFVRAAGGTIIEVTKKKPGAPEKDNLKYSDAGNGNIKFSWNEGDPPIGFGP